MTLDVLTLAADLAGRRQPFVMATVVWRRAPSSGREGAKALVLADGAVRGWLGGACAEPTVVKEALDAMGDGRPRVMLLGPAGDREVRMREGVVAVPMACESEGAMEVHLEPFLPAPHLVVVGESPAVEALVTMAAALGWRASSVALGSDGALPLDAEDVGPGSFVVVASQGHYDETALEAALATGAGYVGLVASRKRAATVFEYLRGRGVPDEVLVNVRAPAGMDLGPLEHREIAVAILAELVAVKASGGIASGIALHRPETATDPVCGMAVTVAGAAHVAEHGGTVYYFCAAGCRARFVGEPARFVESV